MRMNRTVIFASLFLAASTTTSSATQQSNRSPSVEQPGLHQDADDLLYGMIGKRVLGKSREFLGTLVSIDGEKKIAQMKIPTGAVVPLSTKKLSIEEDHVRAATVSRGDVLALVRETGQQGTLEAGVLPIPLK